MSIFKRIASFSPTVKRTLQMNILVTFATLLVVTVLIIIGYTYRQNSNAILRLSQDLIDQVSETVIERTSNHLLPAAVMAQVSAHIPAVDTLSLVNNQELEAYGMEVLRLYPQLAGFFIGNQQGEFLFTKRFPESGIGTQFIDRSGDQPLRTWIYRDVAGNVTQVEQTTDFDYDPRQRPWYVGAESTLSQYWTDVYIFYTDQKPGITASFPVLDDSGALVSVIGIDIALDELSQFLQMQDVGTDGVAFIVNDKGEVIAYPGLALAAREGDTFRPVTVDDLEATWVTAAYHEHANHGDEAFTLEENGRRYIASFTNFPEDFEQNWQIGVVVPEDDFVGTIKHTNQVSLTISLVILVLAIVLAVFISRSISRPIVLLTEDTQRISDLRLDGNLTVNSPIHEVQLLADSISSMKNNLQIFKKYAPAELVRRLIASGEDGNLGGQQKELTVLFANIGGFSLLANRTLPEAMMAQLSEYVGQMGTIVSEQKGTMDTYMGEGMMAFWGAPLLSHHAYYACRTALLFLEAIGRLNQNWRETGRISFPARVGIHTGDTLVGNLGSAEYMNYTVVGESVNLAKYLEAMNSLYGSKIIVSEATYAQVNGQFCLRPLDLVMIKGRWEPLQIYELLAEKETATETDKVLCQDFSQGVAAYRSREWETAVSIFKSLAMQYPADSATQIYLGRCLTLQANPPGADWEPITQLEFLNQPRLST